jgi:molybdenum cofactor guanylyltransferase
MKIKTPVTGIILAGGKSSRLGFNKIEIKVDDIPLFIDQVFKLSFFCDEILISTTFNNRLFIENELAKLDHYNKYFFKVNKENIPITRVVLDEDNECAGSICGIYSSLLISKNFYSIVIAFDMPFISFNVLNFFTNLIKCRNIDKDAYVIKVEKGFECLCGIYSKNCIDPITRNINRKIFKISEMFSELNIELIALEKSKSSLRNIKSDHSYMLPFNIQSYDLFEGSGIDNLSFFNINTPENYNDFLKIWNFFKNKSFNGKWKKFFYR